MENTPKSKILVIDDDMQIRFFIQWVLKDDYELAFAENGQVAERMLLDFMPDLIIADVMMPIKDGFEFCQIVKSNSKTAHIPIIMLSSLQDSASMLKGLSLYATVYLTKPINPEVLKMQVKSVLKNFYSFNSNLIASKSAVKKMNGSQFLNQLVMTIEDNIFDEDMSVDFLAEKMCMSRLTLLRKVKLAAGKDTKDIVKEVKAKVGYKMIVNDGLLVKEVSHKLGYKKVDTFYKAFKDVFNVTPGSLKQKANA